MQPCDLLEDLRRFDTEYVVEATSAEQLALWREHSEEAKKDGWGSPQVQRVAWKQDPGGWIHQVGELAGFPVNIGVQWARIGGALVMFWSPCSRVVDWEMCEAWLRQNVPAYAERQTNATNFGHVLGWLADRADSAAKRGEERMLDIGKLAAKVSSDVYAAAVKHFEEAERSGLIIGNGHHMAQDIAEKAKDLLLERHRKALGGKGAR